MRPIEDIVISACKSVYYTIYEIPRLWIERFLHYTFEHEEKNPLITVYCPTYNRGKILVDRAVKSVLSQTYKNFEFVIIGDHCTDDTEELLSKVKDKRIRFINLPYRKKRYPPTAINHWYAGPVVPANEALKHVRGKWIARIDDDDTWSKTHLEYLLRDAQKRNLEFVSADLMSVKNGEKIRIRAKDQDPPIGGTQTWLYKSYLKFYKYNIDCWRKSWNRVNDYDLQDRMYRSGVRMGYINEVVAYVYPRPGEQSVGSIAYKENADSICKHFEFEE